MIDRCTNPNNSAYCRYGGADITVCRRWRESFKNFIEDMGRIPTPGLTLDRRNGKKGYSPENCRWATPKEQSLNRECVIRITFNGKTQVLSEWCEELKIPYMRAYKRHRRGLDASIILSTDAAPMRRGIPPYEPPSREAEKICALYDSGMSYHAVAKRIGLAWGTVRKYLLRKGKKRHARRTWTPILHLSPA